MKTASLSLLLVGVIASSAHAIVSTVNVDISSLFNADVIVNKPAAGVLDATQTSIDHVRADIPNTGYGLVTQSADTAISTATSITAGTGLPDNGYFAAGNLSYSVTLAYRNSDNGNNARLSTSDDAFTLFIPSNYYSTISFIGTSADGAADYSFVIHYYDTSTNTASSETVSGTLPDWASWSTLPTGTAVLATGYDRALNDASILDPNYGTNSSLGSFRLYAIELAPATDKEVTGIEVTKTGTGHGALLGVTGVIEPAALPTTPEPATLSMLGIGALALLSRRK